VALLNNDAVPISGSLTKLVDLMEGDDQLGAVQGVILNEDGKTIDTAGDYVTELLSVRSLFKGDPPNSLKKPVYATSADAAFSLFRVKAIEQIPHQTNCIFDSCLFGCLDDHLLGLKLWNVGFKIKVYPIITARHRRGSSFREVHALQVYLGLRNLVFVNEISNSRYKNIIRLDCFKQVVTYFPRVFSNNASKELPAILSKAFIDGLKYGHVKRNVGEKIDLYKAPILKLSPFNAFVSTIVSRRFIQNKVEQELRNITD
jgi:GT2 family glycosyltransferase